VLVATSLDYHGCQSLEKNLRNVTILDAVRAEPCELL
jgi:hypothetical protein